MNKPVYFAKLAVILCIMLVALKVAPDEHKLAATVFFFIAFMLIAAITCIFLIADERVRSKDDDTK